MVNLPVRQGGVESPRFLSDGFAGMASHTVDGLRGFANFPSSLKGRCNGGKYGKKKPRAHNRYTASESQNVAWLRDYLHPGLEDKVKRGHVLGRRC